MGSKGWSLPETSGKTTFFRGHVWSSIASSADLYSLWALFAIPNSGILEVLKPNFNAVGTEDFAEKVTLFLSMFKNGLRVPFCRPICEVLDYL